MKITIQAADLSQDKQLLIETLFRHLTRHSDEKRFDWLYRANPHGPARVWFAKDSATGEVIGTSAAFARRFMVNGIENAGWALGDFCIAEKYRTLGPALQLQRATLEAIKNSQEAGLCYDFPSRSLMPIYRRLGIDSTNRMIRLAKPLRLDRKLQQITRSRVFARSFSWLGNLFLRASDSRRSSMVWDVAVHRGECGEEFTALRRRNQSQVGIEIERSAEYLNWRYLRHPLVQYHILTARRGAALEGYLIFSCTTEDAYIAEWNAGKDPGILAALMDDLVRRLRKTRIDTLSAFLLDSDPRFSDLVQIGLRPRESTDVVVFWPGATNTVQNWRLTYGDRDI